MDTIIYLLSQNVGLPSETSDTTVWDRHEIFPLNRSYKKIEPFIRALHGQVCFHSFLAISWNAMVLQASFFDVPLHHKLHQASQAGAEYDLRRILDDTIAQERPGDAVTFVDNHE